MSLADWRALLEAYLDGRLSAEAFERRFLEAWRAERDASGRSPFAIEQLFYVVEAFSKDQNSRSEHEADESELRSAARVALRTLREEGAPPRTYDRARAREEMGRFQIRIHQLAGLGCALAIGWVALCLLQIYFVSEVVERTLSLGVWPSAVIGFFLAFVPVVGNVLAFLGATHEGWATWLAALVFFAAPAFGFAMGFLRWRRLRGGR